MIAMKKIDIATIEEPRVNLRDHADTPYHSEASASELKSLSRPRNKK